jgi:hypothetical protein
MFKNNKKHVRRALIIGGIVALFIALVVDIPIKGLSLDIADRLALHHQHPITIADMQLSNVLEQIAEHSTTILNNPDMLPILQNQALQLIEANEALLENNPTHFSDFNHDMDELRSSRSK